MASKKELRAEIELLKAKVEALKSRIAILEARQPYVYPYPPYKPGPVAPYKITWDKIITTTDTNSVVDDGSYYVYQ